jgi:hypothetical protein
MRNAGLILAMLLLTTSCESMVRDTMNVGGGQGQRLSVTLSSPSGTGPHAPVLAGGESAMFSANVIGVNGPFKLNWNFGGAAENTTSTMPVSGSSSVEVEFVALNQNEQFTATVTCIDGAGISQSDSVTFTVSYDPEFIHHDPPKPKPKPNQAPVISELSMSRRTVNATAADPDNDELVFSAVSLTEGIEVYGPFWATETSAQFYANGNDSGDPLEVTVFVTVEDGRGGSDVKEISGVVESLPLKLKPDHIYAVVETNLLDSSSEMVRISVLTGRTSNPFQYMNGCGVVCQSGAHYTKFTFDVGEPDDIPDFKGAVPIDGVWAAIGATSFLLAPDRFITSTDLGNGTGRTDFNVTPLGGSDINAEGYLFNFMFSLDDPGIYNLGFEAVNVVSRTYYQDSTAATDFFWSNIENNHQYNTIVVN